MAKRYDQTIADLTSSIMESNHQLQKTSEEADQLRLDAQRYRKLRAARSEIFNRTEWAELRACTSFDFDMTIDAKPDPAGIYGRTK